jgi:monoamine oxidase
MRTLNLVDLLGGVGQGQLRLFGPLNEQCKVHGGNDQLVSRMAAGLAGQVETSRALVALRATGSRYTLDVDGGPSVVADRVVLALPFSMLRERVDISGATFPEVKRRAITELGMGRTRNSHCSSPRDIGAPSAATMTASAIADIKARGK